MIPLLLQLFFPNSSVTNLFSYITFRSGIALLTALGFMFVFGELCISWLKSKQVEGQPIRKGVHDEDVFATKQGTPTMGGILIISSVLFSTILWINIFNVKILLIISLMLAFAVIGFIDDFAKLKSKNTKGLTGKTRLKLEIFFSFLFLVALYYVDDSDNFYRLYLPFFKNVYINLSWIYYIIGIFILVGTANSVNITDGLDGLAIFPIMIAISCYGLISYLTGHINFAQYLQIPYIKDVGELAVFCLCFVGAGLGFLWYNSPPAKVFMGDVGSLSAGVVLGALSIMTKQELILPLVGGLFLMETLSVIVQVYSLKYMGKRIFKMAPIHHHFEKKGWAESTIVIRFWIISIILALVGIASLKIR